MQAEHISNYLMNLAFILPGDKEHWARRHGQVKRGQRLFPLVSVTCGALKVNLECAYIPRGWGCRGKMRLRPSVMAEMTAECDIGLLTWEEWGRLAMKCG